MCCLFGIVNYGQYLTKKQVNKITSVLATACEERGTDATGIAYNTRKDIAIFKRPIPAHHMRFHIPSAVSLLMGHTRMTTQGDEKNNYNNHPFAGSVENTSFALAHNGVLYNDTELRKSENLPRTKIETDSYVAVQLIEKQNSLSFDSLKFMAERLKGTYTITVMDRDNNLFFVKGDNPICIYHFEELGLYLYASTEAILQKALQHIPYHFGKHQNICLYCGEILKIDRYGRLSKGSFKTDNLFECDFSRYWYKTNTKEIETADNEYLDILKSVASGMGYPREYIEYLIEDGFTVDDIEEILYCS